MNINEAVPFLDLKTQHRLLRNEILPAIESVIENADFVKGQAVARFEESFAAYQEAKACVAVANGTDALEIALEALQLRPGSEVIVPANSFIATAEAVSRVGLSVVFADVDESYTLDPASVESVITARTSAVIAVHLYGQPADLDQLGKLCAKHGLRLIEDSAQAHGAEFGARRVGAIGDIGTFSFFPGKNLGAMGDAGAIVTNDRDMADQCRQIANHGRIGKYDHQREGRNSRMDTLQATVLGVKLAHLDDWLATRRSAAAIYRRALLGWLGDGAIASADITRWMSACEPGEVRLPVLRSSTEHAYHLFVVRVARRDESRDELAALGIGTGIHYPIPLPRLGAYSAHPQRQTDFRCVPWADELLSLPIGDHMNEPRVLRVAEALSQISSRNANG